jgi:hypothetical protein
MVVKAIAKISLNLGEFIEILPSAVLSVNYGSLKYKDISKQTRHEKTTSVSVFQRLDMKFN